MSSLTIPPARRIEGELSVPGDKAISHRALILACAAEGAITIHGLSPAADVTSTRHSLRALGLIEISEINKPRLEVDSRPSEVSISLKLEGKGSWSAGFPASADCGNSGSTMRMLMGALSGSRNDVILLGDSSLSKRPMKRVADPLQLMGADIELSSGNVPPVRIRGCSLQGIAYDIPVPSAQVKTALLLAGLQAEGRTLVSEPAQTRDHTERMMAHLGCEVRTGDRSYTVEATRLLGDKEINIPGDFSSASFLLTAAAVIEGSEITIHDVGLNPTRTAFMNVLRAFGAEVTVTGVHEQSGEPRGAVTVRASERRPLEIEPDAVPALIDELPLVAVLGSFADGQTHVRGAEELRVKESDRITTITRGLAALGANVQATPDGFTVSGGRGLTGGRASSGGDHRIAMALAVAALGATGSSVIQEWEAVGISYPAFEQDLARITR